MSAYTELKDRHQAEINAFPLHFAFGDEQIRKKKEELGLSDNPTILATQIVPIGAGGFVLKADWPAFVEMNKRHAKERAEAMADEENGPKYLYDMFHYELLNHEYGYTVDVSDTLEALGLTEEDLDKKPILREMLEKAAADIRKAEGFEW